MITASLAKKKPQLSCVLAYELFMKLLILLLFTPCNISYKTLKVQPKLIRFIGWNL